MLLFIFKSIINGFGSDYKQQQHSDLVQMNEYGLDLNLFQDVASMRQDIAEIKQYMKNVQSTQSLCNQRIEDIHQMLQVVKNIVQNYQPKTLPQCSQQFDYPSYIRIQSFEPHYKPASSEISHLSRGYKPYTQDKQSDQQSYSKLEIRPQQIIVFEKPQILLQKQSDIKVACLEYQKQIQLSLTMPERQEKQMGLFKISSQMLSKFNQQKLAKVFDKMDLKFFSCQQIYSYPEMSSINFHQKIDNKSNLLILIEMINSQTIGAFTQLSFDPKPSYIPKFNPKCFLCNLTQERFLFASRINKTHSYDKNYLIFGNWQIKIKTGEKYLESSLGKKGSCFAKKEYEGQVVADKDFRRWLLGQIANDSQDKLLQFKSYSIYTFE